VAGWLLAHDTIRPPIRTKLKHRAAVHPISLRHNKQNVFRIIPNNPHRPGSRWTQLGIKAWQLRFQHIKLLAYMH